MNGWLCFFVLFLQHIYSQPRLLHKGKYIELATEEEAVNDIRKEMYMPGTKTKYMYEYREDRPINQGYNTNIPASDTSSFVKEKQERVFKSKPAHSATRGQSYMHTRDLYRQPFSQVESMSKSSRGGMASAVARVIKANVATKKPVGTGEPHAECLGHNSSPVGKRGIAKTRVFHSPDSTFQSIPGNYQANRTMRHAFHAPIRSDKTMIAADHRPQQPVPYGSSPQMIHSGRQVTTKSADLIYDEPVYTGPARLEKHAQLKHNSLPPFDINRVKPITRKVFSEATYDESTDFMNVQTKRRFGCFSPKDIASQGHRILSESKVFVPMSDKQNIDSVARRKDLESQNRVPHKALKKNASLSAPVRRLYDISPSLSERSVKDIVEEVKRHAEIENYRPNCKTEEKYRNEIQSEIQQLKNGIQFSTPRSGIKSFPDQDQACVITPMHKYIRNDKSKEIRSTQDNDTVSTPTSSARWQNRKLIQSNKLDDTSVKPESSGYFLQKLASQDSRTRSEDKETRDKMTFSQVNGKALFEKQLPPTPERQESSSSILSEFPSLPSFISGAEHDISASAEPNLMSQPLPHYSDEDRNENIVCDHAVSANQTVGKEVLNGMKSSSPITRHTKVTFAANLVRKEPESTPKDDSDSTKLPVPVLKSKIGISTTEKVARTDPDISRISARNYKLSTTLISSQNRVFPPADDHAGTEQEGNSTELPKYKTGAYSVTRNVKTLTLAADNEKVKSTETEAGVDPIVTGQEMQNSKRSSSPISCKTRLLPISDNGRCQPFTKTELPADKSTSLEMASGVQRLSLATDSYANEPKHTATDIHYSRNLKSPVSDFETGISQIGIEKLNTQLTRIEDHKTSGSTAQISGKTMVSKALNEKTRDKHITKNEIPKYKRVTLPTTMQEKKVPLPTVTDTRLKDSKLTDSAQDFTRKALPPVSNRKMFTPTKSVTRSASPVRDNAISDNLFQTTTDGFPFHGQSQFSQPEENQRNILYDRPTENQRVSLHSKLSETSFTPQRTSTPLQSSVDIRDNEKSHKSAIRDALHQRRLRIGSSSTMSDDEANVNSEEEANDSAKTLERNKTLHETKISAVISRPYQGIKRTDDEQAIGAFMKEKKTKRASSSSLADLLFQDEQKRQRVPIEEQRRIKTIGIGEQTGNETNVLEIPRNEMSISAVTEIKRIKPPETKLTRVDPGDTTEHYITEHNDKRSAPSISGQKTPSQKRSSSPICMSINEKDIKTEAATYKTSPSVVSMNTEELPLPHDSQRNILVPDLRKSPSADFGNKIVESTKPKVAIVGHTTTIIEVRNYNRSSSPLSSQERPASPISANRSEEDITTEAQKYKTSSPAVSTNTEELPLAQDSQRLKSQYTVKDVSHERIMRSPVTDPLETVDATDLQPAGMKSNSGRHPSLPFTSQEKTLSTATGEGKAKLTNEQKEYTKMPSSTRHENEVDISIANRIKHQQRAAKDELYSRKSPPPVPNRKRRLSTGLDRKRSASPVHENAISDYVDGLLENISVGLPILDQPNLLETKEGQKSTSYVQTKEKPRICPSINNSELCVNQHDTSTLLQMSVNISDKENNDQLVIRDVAHRRRLSTADSSTTPEDAASLIGDTEAHDSAKITDFSESLHEVLTSTGVSKKIKYIHKIASKPDIEVLLKEIKAKRASSSSLADLLLKDEQKRQHKEPAQEQRRIKTMDVGKLTVHNLSTPNKAISHEAEVPITGLEKMEMKVTKMSPLELPKNKKELSLDTDSKRVAASDKTAARLVTKFTEMDSKFSYSPISNKERPLPRTYAYGKPEQYVTTDTLLSATVNDIKELSYRTSNDSIKPCSSATDFQHARKPPSPSKDHETAPPVLRLENVEATRIEECSGGLSRLPVTSQLPSVKDKIKTQRKFTGKDYVQLTSEIPNHDKEERSATDNHRKQPQPSVTDELQHRKSPQPVTSPKRTFENKGSPSPDQDNDICNYVEAILKTISEGQPVCSQSQISEPKDNQINATCDHTNGGQRIFINLDVSEPNFSLQSLSFAGHVKDFSSATDHAIKDQQFTAEDIPDSRKSPSPIIGNNMLVSTDTVFARVDPSASRTEVSDIRRSPSPNSSEIRATCILPSVNCGQTDQNTKTEASNTKMSQTAIISKNERERVNDHSISDYIDVLLNAISEEFPEQNQASPAEIVGNQKELHDSQRIKSCDIATDFSDSRPMISSVVDHEIVATENKELQATRIEIHSDESHSDGCSSLPVTCQKILLPADTDEIGTNHIHFEKENPKLSSTTRRHENEVSLTADDMNKHQQSTAKEKLYSRKSPPPVPHRKRRLSPTLDHKLSASMIHENAISDYVDGLLENISGELPVQSQSQYFDAKEGRKITQYDLMANVISDKEAHDPAKIPDLSKTLNEVLTSSGISKKIKKIHRIADDPDVEAVLKVRKAKRASVASVGEPLLKDEQKRQLTEGVQEQRHSKAKKK